MKLQALNTLAALALLAASPLAAQDAPTGDAAKGEKEFNKCKACHMIEGPDGAIARGGKVGPNLYGVVGRQAGTMEGFSYSDLMVAAGEKGLMWNEGDFKTYVKDATAFLREYTGESSGRGKMTFKLNNEEAAADIWAYLASVGPATN
ncbi:c-type cytochrome [Tropicibacter sp. S64]|uniref:c-type cytochrome n=1 Tax=Tropicibacter sp. S64 TaxID=3415122 RepID=UPI003C7E5255